jgi:hypothetical protein
VFAEMMTEQQSRILARYQLAMEFEESMYECCCYFFLKKKKCKNAKMQKCKKKYQKS